MDIFTELIPQESQAWDKLLQMDTLLPPSYAAALPPEDAASLARRFYAQQVLQDLTGRQVRFMVDVERETFLVHAGATGVVMDPFLVDGRLVAGVWLDEPPRGSEAYDGEVHWIEDCNLIDFEDEIELV